MADTPDRLAGKRDIANSTYRIRAGDKTGTMFALYSKSRCFMVTARHVVEEADSDLEILWSGDWMPAPVVLIGHCAGEVDISVYESVQNLPLIVDPDWQAPGMRTQVNLAEEIHFFGFPYGIGTTTHPERPPWPLVKAGIISGLNPGHGIVGYTSFWIDGHSNPGFSGGPVVTTTFDGACHISGVVTHHLEQNKDLLPREAPASDPQDWYAQQNTGIMCAWNIQYALDIIVDA